MEDDITRIGSKAEDFLSGIMGAESVSETNSRRKALNQDFSDPFRRFQTPPPGRKSPTPLADLYSQSIFQAEVDSDSWQAPEQNDSLESTDEEDCYSPNMSNVDCMPQDLFSFSQLKSSFAAESPLETLNRSLTDSDNSSVEETSLEYTPKLIVDSTKGETDRTAKRPLLSLSIGMSICGVGLVFGSQIMHNTALVNPGKSLIIAGLIGLFVSAVLQIVNRFGKRKTA